MANKVDVDDLNLDLRKEAPKGSVINFGALKWLGVLLLVLLFVGVKFNEWVNSEDESKTQEANNGVVSEQDTEGVGQSISEVSYKTQTIGYDQEIARVNSEDNKKIEQAKAEAVENTVRSAPPTNAPQKKSEQSSDWWSSSAPNPQTSQAPKKTAREKAIEEGQLLASKVDISFDSDFGQKDMSGSSMTTTGMNLLNGGGLPSPPTSPQERESTNSRVDEIVRGMQQKDPVVSQNQQKEKQNYIDQNNNDFINSGQLRSAPSPYMVRAGDSIPVVLLRGVNTDLPGEIVAIVERDVYDSVTGQHLLIPKMSRFIGSYQSVLSYGQERILSTWNRLDLPNGDRIALDKFTAADLKGFAGFKGEVDSHTWATISGAFLSAVLSVGSAAGQNPYGGNEISAGDIAKRGVAESASTVGEEHVSRSMNRQNTLTALIGKRFVINVNKDLLLRPYTSAR